MSKASELLDNIIAHIFCGVSKKNLGPGQYIMNLSQEKRDILKTLTSDELSNRRPDSIFGAPSIEEKFRRSCR